MTYETYLSCVVCNDTSKVNVKDWMLSKHFDNPTTHRTPILGIIVINPFMKMVLVHFKFVIDTHTNQTIRTFSMNHSNTQVERKIKTTLNTSQLRILSMNVWCHYPMSVVKQSKDTMWGFSFRKRLQLLISAIAKNKYDIVCVQELFVAKLGPLTLNGNLLYMIQEMQKCGLVFSTTAAATKSTPRFIGQNSGLVIFSRFPIIDICTHTYKSTAEFGTTKGCVSVVVAPDPMTRVRVVNTHMNARSKTVKEAQVRELVAFIKTHNTRKPTTTPSTGIVTATIVCGDFNVCPQPVYDDGSEYKFLQTQMLDELELKNACPAKIAEMKFTCESATLDHIFISDVLHVQQFETIDIRNTNKLRVSDHLGVSATLSV